MIILLVIIFVGIARMMLEIAYGRAPAEKEEGTRHSRESVWLLAGPAGLMLLVLTLGLYIPTPVRAVLERAAITLGGRVP
jgi:hypothetical protein